jgi:ATP-dependent Clp protease adaptor protein ClpS
MNKFYDIDTHTLILPMGTMQDDDDGDVTVLTRPKQKLEQPKMWSVLFRNDDYTPIEFVVAMMVTHFNLDLTMATRLTIEAHERGCVKIGRYTFDVAETKADAVNKEAATNEFPLKVEPTEAD